MPDLASLWAIVHGRVQGVLFRAFVERHASLLRLTGYVRNLPGGRALEVKAEGERVALEELLRLLHTGPPLAKVERVDFSWAKYSGDFKDFRVRY